MKIVGIVFEGREAYAPAQDQMMSMYLSTLKNGKPITKEVKPFRESKSQKQLGAIFGLLISSAIEQANEQALDTSEFLKLMVKQDLPSGVPLTRDFLYELLLLVCPVYDSDHKKLTLSSMNTEEAARFFSQCQNLLCSRGIYISDPDVNWRENVDKDKKKGKM